MGLEICGNSFAEDINKLPTLNNIPELDLLYSKSIDYSLYSDLGALLGSGSFDYNQSPSAHVTPGIKTSRYSLTIFDNKIKAMYYIFLLFPDWFFDRRTLRDYSRMDEGKLS